MNSHPFARWPPAAPWRDPSLRSRKGSDGDGWAVSTLRQGDPSTGGTTPAVIPGIGATTAALMTAAAAGMVLPWQAHAHPLARRRTVQAVDHAHGCWTSGDPTCTSRANSFDSHLSEGLQIFHRLAGPFL